MKSTKKRTLRCKRCKTNRRHKRVKGGMFRKGAKTAFEILGKTSEERAKSVYDLLQAALDGAATKETTKKGAQVANYSTRSFEDIASPPSPFHISHVENTLTPRMSYHNYDSDENKNPNYKTPKKTTSSTEPILPSRQRQSQTPNTRARRLSSIVAITVDQPTPLAARLSFGDDAKNDE